jgi:hypothetical protein
MDITHMAWVIRMTSSLAHWALNVWFSQYSKGPEIKSGFVIIWLHAHYARINANVKDGRRQPSRLPSQS